MNFDLAVSPEAFKYLIHERGEKYDLHHDFETWLREYNADVKTDFDDITRTIGDALSILDVGAGMGGIDVLLHRYWGCVVTLLDGENDKPEMHKHNVPFCNREVALASLRANGVTRCQYVSPERLDPIACDLVISLGSWCFHYPPNFYLDYVLNQCRGVEQMIVDLRQDRPAWMAELLVNFKVDSVLREGPKFQRLHLVRT